MPLLCWVDGRIAGASFYGNDRKHDVFLCCPGPSLAKADLNAMRVPGASVWAINTAYPRVKPDVWVGMDSPASYDPNLWFESFIKVAGSKYLESRSGGEPIKGLHNTFFADGMQCRPWEMFENLGPETSFYWPQLYMNTMFLALHMAYWTGAKRAYLVGCDLGGAQDYHDDRVLSDDHRNRNRELYHSILCDLPMLRMEAEKHGLELISCTPDSPANEYLKYLSIEDAAKLANSHVPVFATTKTLDAGHANLCEWTTEKPLAEKGVVVPVDKNMEWLLEWWWNNYSKHNKYPVCFADYGLSPEGLNWCAQRAIVCTSIPKMKNMWHQKPTTILRSPFVTTVLIEPDCEVRGSIEPIMDDAAIGLALTDDPHNPWCKEYRPLPYATGVVGAKRGNGLIEAWMQTLLLDPTLRSDQEGLNKLLSDLEANGAKPKVITMPHRFQWLRLDGDDGGQAVIYHWTGKEGKDEIRRQINTDKPKPLVSIVSCASGRLDLFEKHIEALSKCERASECEYVVGVWGGSEAHQEILARYKGKFSAIKVADLKCSGIFWPLPVAYNSALSLAKSDKVLVIGSDVIADAKALTVAAGVQVDRPIVFGVDNSDGQQFIGSDRMVAMPFCLAIAKENLDRIGGWDRAFENGIAFDDNDFAARLIVSNCTFEFDLEHKATHQAHPKSHPPEAHSMWALNNAVFRSRLGGFRGDLGVLNTSLEFVSPGPEQASAEAQAELRAKLLSAGYQPKW